MKILFICGALEEGKDGVGDYTRRLAGELVRHGHQATIIAYNDRHISTIMDSVQQDGDTAVQVLRLPSVLKAKEKVKLSRDYAQQFQPDWISLQFVIYSFHSKGLPFFLTRQLKQIGNGYKWHIMFHELWIGEYKDDHPKDKLIGYIQQKIIQRIYKLGSVIHVTGEFNQKLLLYRSRRAPLLLPICSNIGAQSKPKIAQSLNENFRYRQWYVSRQDYFIVVNFGNYYYSSWDIKNVISNLDRMAVSNGRKLVLLSIGNIGEAAQHKWNSLSDNFENILVDRLGQLPEDSIAEILTNYADMGIVTTPLEIIYKSGTFHTFREFGIPVLAKKNSRTYRLKADKSSSEETAYLYDENSDVIIERAVSKSNWNLTLMYEGFCKSLLSN